MSFQHHQAAFAAYIRNPEQSPLPAGVKPERMAMYRELFFNNINGFLTANFPVLHRLFDENEWANLVQDFFSQHVCQTPHFSEIAEEFLAYLQHERQCATDFPFLAELAHYEWVEMALSITDAQVLQISLVDLEATALQISPLAGLLAYQFPVHQISPVFLPLIAPEQATFLVAYRDIEDVVQFLEMTPLTYQLLQLVEMQPAQLAKMYLMKLADFAPTIAVQTLQEKGLEILKDFVQRGVIVAA